MRSLIRFLFIPSCGRWRKCDRSSTPTPGVAWISWEISLHRELEYAFPYDVNQIELAVLVLA